MKPQIGISEKHLSVSIEMLSIILADEMVLYVKTRKFHWNVSGESFMELHKLFQNQYTELEETIDTMHEFANITRLKESPNKYPNQKDMMKELLEDYETLIVEIRKDIETCNEKNKDAGTVDFLTAIMEQHESTAWILRRYLN
jgi:starvation-inducible DNA-binding protein